jgi:hypothetical protein
MEKVGDDVHFGNAIASTFRLRHDLLSGDLAYTDVCGLGWRFAICLSIEPSKLLGGGSLDQLRRNDTPLSKGKKKKKGVNQSDQSSSLPPPDVHPAAPGQDASSSQTLKIYFDSYLSDPGMNQLKVSVFKLRNTDMPIQAVATTSSGAPGPISDGSDSGFFDLFSSDACSSPPRGLSFMPIL